jgi:hypothetical protein
MIKPEKLEIALKAVRLTISQWTKSVTAFKASHLDQRGINGDPEDMRIRLLNLQWRESRLIKPGAPARAGQHCAPYRC